MSFDDPTIVSIMAATAMPTNADTFFVQLAGPESAVVSRKRYPATPAQIEGALNAVDPVVLFVSMLNEGNFIDISAWLNKLEGVQSAGQAKWVQIATAIQQIVTDTSFHYCRAKILHPFGPSGEGIDQSLIEHCKQNMLRIAGVPPNVPPDMISWDFVSFKIPPVAIEFLAHRFEQLLETLDQHQVAILDQVEKEAFALIRQKMVEYRQRSNTVEDDLLPDMSLFLEQYVGGLQDPERAQKIASVGRGMLIQYVSDMLPIFSTGNLPSTVAPAKIYACHDIVSSAELRGTIMKLAEAQVIQQSTIIDRKLIMNRAYALSEGMDYAGKDWTKQQMASMAIKKNVDDSMRRVSKTFGVSYDQPMKNLENQLAGSSNTLGTQMEGHTTDAVLTMNEEQEEIARHTLSVLLACLRMRANAVQQSGWELLSDQDLDHLEIVKFLSQQQPEPSSGDNILTKVAIMLQEEYQNGHNVVKFGGKQLEPELTSMIMYSLRGRVASLVRQIPMFDQDLRSSGGSGIFDVYMWCLMQSMVQKQRILMEIQERTQRKVVSDAATESMY